MRIAQAMNALDRADAVSQHLLELDRAFRELGHETEIYSQYFDPSLASRRRPIEELPSSDADLVLFHYAGFSDVLGFVARFQGRRGLVYHNVTPSHFFRDEPDSFEFCERGRRQVADLPRTFDFAWADSSFNAAELREVGLEAVRVIPLPWEASGLDAVEAEPPPEREGVTRLLMVGRVVRHKGAHHAIAALGEIERQLGGPVELRIVGRTRGSDAYVAELREQASAAGATDRVRIVGEVTRTELRGEYEAADVLLVLSEHEGFCVPIVEAHAFGVPIVAYDTTAVAETLGEGGRLLVERSPAAIAEAVASVAPGGPDRAAVLVRQRDRLPSFSREGLRPRIAEGLDWVLGLPAPDRAEERPPVSIVVCTYNRDWVLEKCLEGLRQLDYPEFEVIVVNGPSTDSTDAVISRFPEVQRVENPRRNLSVSRNLGIAAAAGEIVAFIDDDAMPAADWLQRLADAYRDPAVGAAGGRVHGPGGDHLQFDNGIISRWSLPRALQAEPDDCNDPNGEWFNIVMGTNSSFRRSVLDEVGGFDENYEYYHDESDLCVRVIRAGYRVEHVPDAEVWHEFEKSRVRKTVHDVNWTVVVKNTIYFYFKLNDWKRRPWDVVQPLRACLVHLGIFSRWFVHGEIGPRLFLKSGLRWCAGLLQGYAKGLFVRPRRDLALRRDPRRNDFQPVRTVRATNPRGALHVALVSQQYPPDSCGGIGVYTERLAQGLVRAGHRVTVLAHAAEDSVTWRDGVLVHRLRSASAPRDVPRSYSVTRKNLARSLEVQARLEEIHARSPIDVVESPLWDAEAYVPALRDEFPLVLRINTPMAMAIETQGWEPTEDLGLACEMEWRALRGCHGVIDASGTILRTIAERWDVRPDQALRREIPFGVPLPDSGPGNGGSSSSGVHFVFLGRLERRKGIEPLVAAIPRVLREAPAARFTLAGDFLPGENASTFTRGWSDAERARVDFTGWIDDDARDRLYSECDVFVAPSLYESFGIVYIEALSHGKPVVACDVGGAPAIVDESCGVLVPPDNAEALAAALLALAKDAGRRESMSRAARQRAEREYTVDRMTSRTVDFYEEVLDARGGERE